MAREGQGYPCYQRDMMMMMIISTESRNHISHCYGEIVKVVWAQSLKKKSWFLKMVRENSVFLSFFFVIGLLFFVGIKVITIFILFMVFSLFSFSFFFFFRNILLTLFSGFLPVNFILCYWFTSIFNLTRQQCQIIMIFLVHSMNLIETVWSPLFILFPFFLSFLAATTNLF